MTFPPDAPPPASEPIVSVAPPIVRFTPAAFARLIADESPHRSAAVQHDRSAINIEAAANVPGPVPAVVAVLKVSGSAADLVEVCAGNSSNDRPAPGEIETLRIDRSAARRNRDAAIMRWSRPSSPRSATCRRRT